MIKEEEIRLDNLKKLENDIRKKYGIKLIAGIDEAGRGPIAGPVVVAVCIMPQDSKIEKVDDSKKLTKKKREELYEIITNEALSYAVGIVDNIKIDEINILEATKKALTIAIENLKLKPEYILTDALDNINTLNIPYASVIQGDKNVYSISCASIIAKVTRDRIMEEYAKKYPEYLFEKHKGYGTKAHYEALKEYGLTPIHRKSFIHLDEEGNRIKLKR